VLSFLTTTGFESAGWAQAQVWSGLSTPGLMLAGLAVIGGGVATTAGGVKLLRVYALYRHGEREMERLVHPNSVGGSGVIARRLRRQGALVAWIFFMLFAMSIALVMLALSLTGLNFETTTVLAVSALSTTGPLAGIAAETPISWAGLGGAAQVILAAAMVLGRLETLAIIALLNPDFWRG
jgi:trk system potassium uptake protein TrkH